MGANMKTYIQNLSELTDSKELLELKPQRFIIAFIYIIMAIIIAAITWSYFGEIDTYVKASGVVRPAEKISAVRNNITGRIERVNIEDGQQILKGEVLYTIEQKSLQLKKELCIEQLGKLNEEISSLEKYKKSIESQSNLLNPNNTNEKMYYNLFLKYQTDRETSIEQSKQQEFEIAQIGKEADLALKSAESKLQIQKQVLEFLERLRQSILYNENLFQKYEMEYYNRYIDYEFKYNTYVRDIELREHTLTQIKILYDVGSASTKEVEDIENQLKTKKFEHEKYKNENLLSIESSLEQSKQSIYDLELSIEKAKNSIDTNNGKDTNLEIILQKQEIDTIVQIEENIKSNKKSVESLEQELKTLELSIQEATIIAPIDGTINMLQEISVGDLLQAGTEIATIVPLLNDSYNIQLYISNKDIANIQVGQNIKYNFYALPYQEYGSLEGKVKKIGIDAKSDKNSASYYIVEAAIANKPVYSYKGEESEIKVGMTCEAQIITESKKILNWLLEKIDLKE